MRFGEACDLTVERLLEEPYRVIDFLPEQVPADSGGQYSAVERYFAEPPRIGGFLRRCARLLLKLNCYFGFVVGNGAEWRKNPPPQELAGQIGTCGPGHFLNILIPEEDALVTLYGDDLYMTLFHPSDKLVRLVGPLAASEGLFLRRGGDF